MSRFLTPIMILDGKVPEDFGISKISGSSMTIPGQGSDLAQIIASVVKLPPIDERSFDVSSDGTLDPRALQLKTDLDALYLAEQRNAGLDARERQKARENAGTKVDQAHEDKDDKPSEENEDK